MSANPLAWIASGWDAAVAQFGEWAYVGAAYGVFTLVMGGLAVWYGLGYRRARRAARDQEHAA